MKPDKKLPAEAWSSLFKRPWSESEDAATELLCKCARIPPAFRGQFRREVFGCLQLDSLNTPPEVLRALDDIEKNLRAAYSTLLTIPREWWMIFAIRFNPERLDPAQASPLPPSFIEKMQAVDEHFDPAQPAYSSSQVYDAHDYYDEPLRLMIERCSEYTGRGPHVAPKSGKRGRRKNDRTKDTYPLRAFIEKIALAVKRNGGKLTLDRTKQRGTWVDALNGLRPLLPKGFIPAALPLSVIEEIQAATNKTPLRS